jgi:hypothetical protein
LHQWRRKPVRFKRFLTRPLKLTAVVFDRERLTLIRLRRDLHVDIKGLQSRVAIYDVDGGFKPWTVDGFKAQQGGDDGGFSGMKESYMSM